MIANRRICIAGVFDMENYGDLLFPIVARHRLAPFGIDVTPIAPTDRSTGMADALAPLGIPSVMRGEHAFDGIMVGGGYIVHTQSMALLEHYELRDAGDWAGASLWLGATIVAGLQDIPVVWNAPGVLYPFTARQQPFVDAALRASDYVSVRDRKSASALCAPLDTTVAIVPDSIAEIARMWPMQDLSPDFVRFCARKGLRPEERLVAIHLRDRSIGGIEMDSFAAMLDGFASAQHITPVLVAVGRSHDDPGVARQLSRQLEGRHILLDDPGSLREVTAVLAHASLYIGASLHGYVASAAYGVPGVLVARPAYNKFKGFLDHCGRTEDLVRSWPDAFRLAVDRTQEARSPRIPTAVFDALDEHWSRIREGLSDPGRKRAERAALITAFAREGIRAGGPHWALRPFLSRPMASSAPTVQRPPNDPERKRHA